MPDNGCTKIHRPAWLWLMILAALRLLLHTLTNGQYGFHRDELATLADARHLDWGFPAYPPLTPFVARVAMDLFGQSPTAVRFFTALAQTIAMVVTGIMARELGGNRQAQITAALAVFAAPVSIAAGHLFQYVSFDYLWCVLTAYFVIRLLRGKPALVARHRRHNRRRLSHALHHRLAGGGAAPRFSAHAIPPLACQPLVCHRYWTCHTHRASQPVVASAAQLSRAGIHQYNPCAGHSDWPCRWFPLEAVLRSSQHADHPFVDWWSGLAFQVTLAADRLGVRHRSGAIRRRARPRLLLRSALPDASGSRRRCDVRMATQGSESAMGRNRHWHCDRHRSGSAGFASQLLSLRSAPR